MASNNTNTFHHATTNLARKIMRDVRNVWSYEEVENAVRDATSNSNDPPTPAQVKKVSETLYQADSYDKAFNMIWRRMTDLAYKRHVAKALLLLDSLVRIRPPNKTIQLKLIVDIRERWAELYRLARLRPSSSSATIAQIQRVAERLCEFIMRFESGQSVNEEESDDDDDDEKNKRKRTVKRTTTKTKKTTTTTTESDGEDELKLEYDDDNGGDDDNGSQRDRIGPLKPLPVRPMPASHTAPPVSPFGFDLLADKSFQWTPAPSQKHEVSVSDTSREGASVSSDAHNGWSCQRCTFVNAPDAFECAICGLSKAESERLQNEANMHGWDCAFCSFHNQEASEACEVCEHGRYDAAQDGALTEGKSEAEEVLDHSLHGIDASKSPQLPGAWTCAWCSWLNPPTAINCEVCDKVGTRSAVAHDVKLEMQQKVDRLQRRGTDPRTGLGLVSSLRADNAGIVKNAAGERVAWSCPRCHNVNQANRTSCAVCGVPSSYAAELALTGGAGSAYTSNQTTPSISPGMTPPVHSPKNPSRRATLPPQKTVSAQSAAHNSAQSFDAAADAFSDAPMGFAPGRGGGGVRPQNGEGMSGGGDGDDNNELVDLLVQQGQMTQQLAALQHYNAQTDRMKAESGWSCASCSYLNPPSAVRCEMCRSERPNKLQIAKAAAAVNQTYKAAAPLISSSAPTVTAWSCTFCTFHNAPTALACSMCAQPRAADAPIIEAPSAQTQLPVPATPLASARSASAIIPGPPTSNGAVRSRRGSIDSVLSALPPSTGEVGPAPRPADEPKFPAQYQLAAAAAAQQQQLLAMQQYAALTEQQRREQMIAAQRAQQLANYQTSQAAVSAAACSRSTAHSSSLYYRRLKRRRSNNEASQRRRHFIRNNNNRHRISHQSRHRRVWPTFLRTYSHRNTAINLST